MRHVSEYLPYSTSSETKMHMELECKQQNNENIVDI